MRTCKAISTISYNTQEFLVMKLEELIDAHIISYYMLVNHFPEEDEKKAHIHVYIQPNRLIDTMELGQKFFELDVNNPTKPLKCIDFRTSKTDDWILYNLHYAPYLAMKSETRVYHYEYDDIVASDEDTLEYYYNHALKGSEFAQRHQIISALINEELTPDELISNGTVPLSMACQLKAYYSMKHHHHTTYRGGRANHEEEEC